MAAARRSRLNVCSLARLVSHLDATLVKLFDLTCIIVRETPAAILVDAHGDGETLEWLPKSQIEYAKVEGKHNLYEVTMPEWLALEKKLC